MQTDQRDGKDRGVGDEPQAGRGDVLQGHRQPEQPRPSRERDEPRVDGARSAAGDSYVDWLAVTEISDDDYRSFCWPCHDLDEPVSGDGAGTERAG